MNETEQEAHDRRSGKLKWVIIQETFESSGLEGSLYRYENERFSVRITERSEAIRTKEVFQATYKTKEKAKRAAANFVNEWEE